MKVVDGVEVVVFGMPTEGGEEHAHVDHRARHTCNTARKRVLKTDTDKNRNSIGGAHRLNREAWGWDRLGEEKRSHEKL